MRKQLIEALKQMYLGAIATANANIGVYLQNSVGIGEHPDIIAAIDSQVEIAAHAQEKLDYLDTLEY